ncbi:MAG: hypothetical protein A2Z21_04875 [Candidatus Fraserbacteria bacterium RBG_16_55_9]|uniref:Uncharacterized protein n=1 Tax=Fraserbacteria sp. (strain RBG_16_55_9) TaxID=1817864 RepID=A0A1F5UPV8_FRAXR|nr:MAG: hypothetical protein A2Z21_04875 [Candidatus Fraserbacteria bacterium RBG_16_55_9]
MQHTNMRLMVTLVGLFTVVLFSSPAVAQDEFFNPQRGIGLSISFPFAFLPAVPLTTSSTFFLNLVAQGQLNQQLVNQLELRFFFDSLGFQTALTSLRESMLVLFSSSPAVFYLGSGIGAFPIRVPAVPSDGLLLSFLLRAGFEVQVASFGLFLDVSYETMPQPFADIAGGTFSPATISALLLSFGVLIHF